VSAPVVRVADVSIAREGRAVLEDISFEAPPGAFVGVIGPNGAGKTTLLRAILGLVPLSAGSIEVLGRPAGERARSSNGIGYVPQRHAFPPDFPARALDVVRLGRMHQRESRAREREAAEEALTRVGIAELASRPVGRLSGGEQRRVTLAQALCASTRLLILDEPTVGLDLPAEQEFYALVRRLQDELGLAVIAVSHDLLALAGEADRLVCINRRMHIHGSPEDVIHSHALREAYSCEFDFLAGEIAHHEQHATANAAPTEASGSQATPQAGPGPARSEP
jgi:ABC-type Mn2+/Zn2+ transport system ATPase subunit